jgi:ketosteroid isomerase-like protein
MGQSVVMRQPMPAVAAVVSFIDAINRGDLARLVSLMSDDHRLQVFDEAPLDGKEANIAAWTGYTSSFPDHVIYPHRVEARNKEGVVVLGHTTGSHLDLPDEQESRLMLLWKAVVRDGRVKLWQLIADTPERRAEFGVGR